MPTYYDTARAREIADAIVTTLNSEVASKDEDGAAIPTQFTARRVYLLEYDNIDLAKLRVDVRPTVVIREEQDRGSNRHFYGVEICVQKRIKKLTDDNTSTVDELVDLANRIERLFPIGEIESLSNDPTGTQVVESTHLLYDPDKLSQGKFYSLLSLTMLEM